MGNNALTTNGNFVNGGVADVHINTHGSDWYFAVCALMGLTALAVFSMSFKERLVRNHVFYYITALINFVAMIAYFSMGSNLGWTPIGIEFQRSGSHVAGATREIFYARYVDWVITTPLLLMDILLTAGMPWPRILFACVMDEIMIVCGLLGALTATKYKWGYFTFGCAAMLVVFFELVAGWNYVKTVVDLNAEYVRSVDRTNPNTADRVQIVEKKIRSTYMVCTGLTLLLWTCYPIAWGLCEGGNVIGADGEAIFYGILDVLAKPVFSAILIFGHMNVDSDYVGLLIQDHTDPSAYEKPAAGLAYQGGSLAEERLVGNDQHQLDSNAAPLQAAAYDTNYNRGHAAAH